MRKYIEKAKPDFIWMHTILRYIGPWGIKAIHDSGIPHALMHHDLGLIVARPSRLEHESELPENLSLKNFLQGSSSLREYCMRCIKYSSLVLIWKYLSKAEFHIVPANFMYDSISKISGKDAILFPHTIIDTLPFENTSKKEK